MKRPCALPSLRRALRLSFAGGLLVAAAAVAPAVPLEMTYQAQLIGSLSGSPIVSSNVDVALRLYDGPGLGAVLLDTQVFPGLNLSTTNGIVNLTLDMTGVPLAGDLYVEVLVDDLNDAGPVETLSPRQKITSVAFSLNSDQLQGSSLAAINAYADAAAATAESDANAYTDTEIAAATTALQGYADAAAATAESDANTYADGVAATAEADANAYTDSEIAAATTALQTYADTVAATAESDANAYTDAAIAGIAAAVYNRTVFVNPDITQGASPDGSVADPFDNIGDAYAYAKTITGAGSFFDRIAVVLMPGRHTLASTLVMDTVGIDLVGGTEFTAFIEGTPDPLIELAAGTSGAVIRDCALSADSAGTNRCLLVSSGGRIKNVQMRRPGGTAGTLLEVAAPNGFSAKGFEIYGNVLVTNYGSGGANTTFNDGFATGSFSSTGTTTTTELLALINISGVGSLSFDPAGAGAGVGVLAISNLLQCGSVTLSTAESVLQIGNANFAGAAVGNPAAGSVLVNSVATAVGWTGTLGVSGGNTLGYTAFIAK